MSDTRHITRSAEDIAAGKYELWSLVQPLWYEINIYGSKTVYDSSAEKFTAAQRRALAWVRYNNEVFDGGHRQFLINDVGMVWRDALECMEMIGAVKSANRLRKIVSAFGGEIPFERSDRVAAFGELYGARGAFYDLIERCDSEYTFGDRADKPAEMLSEYAKAHSREFALDGDFRSPSSMVYCTKRIIRTAEELASGRFTAADLMMPLRCGISIYDGKARYDSDSAHFTEAQRRAFAWDYYNDEVLNGGHQQFLINSTGIVWKEALECMEMIGADEAAAVLRRIVKAFGGSIPFERNERTAAFDDLWDRRNKTFPELLEKCDRAYYSKGLGDKTSELLGAYVKAHPQEFAIDGEFRYPD